MVDHLSGGGMHVQVGRLVEGALGDIGQHIGVDAVPVARHVDVGDDVGGVAHGLTYGLRPFDKEPAVLAAALGAGEFRDSADSIGFRIVKQLSVDWHAIHTTAQADIHAPRPRLRIVTLPISCRRRKTCRSAAPDIARRPAGPDRPPGTPCPVHVLRSRGHGCADRSRRIRGLAWPWQAWWNV